MKIISLGLGVQSTALYLMSSMGELPRADWAVVADPGGEKAATYRFMRWLQEWADTNGGVPIVVNNGKNLLKDILSSDPERGRWSSSIPSFTQNPDGSVGMLRRQCTNEYKIEQVDKAIRVLYGLEHRQRFPPTEVWKGISLEEMDRMNEPDSKWKTHVYPYCGFAVQSNKRYNRLEWGRLMSRTDLIAWYSTHGFPLPEKSSCVFCPYQSDSAWATLKTKAPDDFAQAVAVDEAIRNSSKKGITQPVFLHRSLKPLKEVVFQEQNDLWGGDCSGNCHI